MALLDLKRFCDDRGTLDQVFNMDLPFNVKRIYVIYSNKDIIRGFHGHKKEWKAFYIAKGSAKFNIVNIKTKEVKTYVLNEKKPQLLVVPNGYYNGLRPLEDNTIIFCLSSATLEESKKDDIRTSPFAFGKEIWEVESR